SLEVRDRAKIWLAGIQGGRALAAIADELLVPIDRADRDDSRMPIGAPDAPTRPCVRAAPAIWASLTAIARRKEHENALADRLRHLLGEEMVRIARIHRVPNLLVDAQLLVKICGVNRPGFVGDSVT